MNERPHIKRDPLNHHWVCVGQGAMWIGGVLQPMSFAGAVEAYNGWLRAVTFIDQVCQLGGVTTFMIGRGDNSEL